MFDLETLDTGPNAVVLTLGAVKFDPRSNYIDPEGLLLRFDVDQQFAMGRVHSESTIEWWSKQAPETQEAAFGGERMDIADALDLLHKFMWNRERVWSQGSFDVNIMENLLTSLKRPFPWQYWAVRDSRTLFDFVDGELDRSKHHDAMEDAKSQARGVQVALKKIGWTGTKIL